MQPGPILEVMDSDGHQTVISGRDEKTGLEAIIAIHSTVLGPALGGVRMLPYPSESAALEDVLRLSMAMSLKSAAAGLDLGGGKAVIIADPATDKTPDLLHAFGRLVDRLNGSYITAEDVGTTVGDLTEVRRTTRWVTGLPKEMGGSGDPSPMTARGVVAAMEAVAAHLWDTMDLSGRTIAIQGVGKVGAALADLLADRQTRLVISDVDEEAVQAVAARTGARTVDPGEILSEECDVLAPCALGGVLNTTSIPRLGCEAIVGSANNQLATPDDAYRLANRGILYAPDYVANSGGIVNISVELEPDGYDEHLAVQRVDNIRTTTADILTDSLRHGTTPADSALQRAWARIREGAHQPPPPIPETPPGGSRS